MKIEEIKESLDLDAIEKAGVDQLTGAGNCAKLMLDMEAGSGRKVFAILMDLDGSKARDSALKAFADHVRRITGTRPQTRLYRLGSGKFLLTSASGPRAVPFPDWTLASIKRWVWTGDNDGPVTSASIGLADGPMGSELVAEAYEAMHVNKRSGRSKAARR